jgi:hypothetical protein
VEASSSDPIVRLLIEIRDELRTMPERIATSIIDNQRCESALSSSDRRALPILLVEIAASIGHIAFTGASLPDRL